MAISRQQITSRGIAQQSGLETFSSIINYTGEFVNFGNPLDYGLQFDSAVDYETTSATPHIGALVGSPPYIMNQWYTYRSAPPLYTKPNKATGTDLRFVLRGIQSGGLPSYCGMYQKLSLTTGKEYRVNLRMYFNTSIATGSLTINTYTPVSFNSSPTYNLTSTATKEIPNSSGDLGLFESEFTAMSSNDVLLIFFTTTETSIQNCFISDISIQEKQEYLVPVYADDIYGNAHQVLRIAASQIIP
tara:strand:+ start:5916 stop:6650 length:735 start_codon:yes stop_codon:yes gene_type:complete